MYKQIIKKNDYTRLRRKRLAKLIRIADKVYRNNINLVNELVHLILFGCKVHLSKPIDDMTKMILQRDYKLFVY